MTQELQQLSPNVCACVYVCMYVYLSMYPEGDPGQHDDEDAGHVDLDEEVAGVPLQVERHLQHRELTCKCAVQLV